MTIYALSSGPGISGIAVIRLSGKETSKVIKILTERTKKTSRSLKTAQITKHQRTSLIKICVLDVDFISISGNYKTAGLITNSVGRISRFALSFNSKVNFNLVRRGHKCSEVEARQLLVRWE